MMKLYKAIERSKSRTAFKRHGDMTVTVSRTDDGKFAITEQHDTELNERTYPPSYVPEIARYGITGWKPLN